MANIEITLKANKPVGVPLTFAEMDQNFASFFYSASAYEDVNGFNRLRLHYTGSSQITGDFGPNNRYLDVLLPDAQGGISGAEVGGSDQQIQFNDGGSLAGDPEFLFDKTTNRVSIGLNTLDSTLTLRGTTSTAGTVVKLNSSNTTDVRSQSYLDISKGNSTRLKVGLIGNGSTAIPTIQASAAETGLAGGLEIGLGANKHIKVDTNGTTIGVGATLTAPNKTLTVIGQIGIGTGITDSVQSTLQGLSTVTFTGALANYLPTSACTAGLMIASPSNTTNGGNVVVGINASSAKNETFSIFSGNNGTFNCSIATFKADGKIGFNQRNPLEILHVEGNITGSDNIQVEGTATVKTISELASLTTDWEGSNTEYARTLVKSSTGLVQYMDAAPIPKGGIIMWAGAVDNVPKGWRLCDGTDENGVAVPDLRERFIVGAGGSGNANTSVTGTAYNAGATGGNNYNKQLIAGNIPKFTLNVSNHNHWNTNSTVYGLVGPAGGDLYKVEGYTGAAPSNDNYRLETLTKNTGAQTLTLGSEDPTAIDIRPPYYALAFIIYVGVE